MLLIGKILTAALTTRLTLRPTQENLLTPLRGCSKLMNLRRYAVDFLAVVAEKYRLNSFAQHLAVAIYDRFTDSYDVAACDFQILLICSLSIACE